MTDPESRSTDRGRSAQPGGPETTPGQATPVVLSLRAVSKAFGAVRAVREVSVDCRAGEIHALVGENGSGKSTLLGIASGFLAPDEGTVEIGGRPLATASVAEAIRLGLGMAYQTYSQVLAMSVAENLYLAAPPTQRPAFGDMETWAARKLDEFRLAVPVAVAAGSLSLAERQLLEVVKALLAEPRVLLLDEPTTALGPEEIEQLHALVFERSRTGVGVMYVSHRLPEVLGIADRITVLRDGVSQGTFDAAGMSEDALVALMIGRPLGQAFPDRDSLRPDEVCLEVTGLQGERFGPIDLEVRRGEILGIAGAEGNGQVPFLRSVAGVEHSTGTVRCNGGSSGHAVAGRPTQSRRDAPLRRPGPGVVVSRAQRSCEHDDPGSADATAGWAFSAAGASGEPFSISCAGSASGWRRSSSPRSRCRAEISRKSPSRARSCGAPCMRSSPTSRPRASTSALASTSTRRCAARRGRGWRSSSSRAIPSSSPGSAIGSS